jgi:hypothetical protein
MVQILNFDDAMHARAATARRQSDLRRSKQNHTARAESEEDSFSFWPEVSSGLWVSQGHVPSDPKNSPGRVFTEMLLILGGAGLLVLLTTVFLGAPQ